MHRGMANDSGDMANTDDSMANTEGDMANTYKYRDADKRRAYMRGYISKSSPLF